MSDGRRCPRARHLSISKSLRATTAELDDLRVPLLGCTDQIVRAESVFCVRPSSPRHASVVALRDGKIGWSQGDDNGPG
jgi:hypothetical protein